jgi:hypothetical protein
MALDAAPEPADPAAWGLLARAGGFVYDSLRGPA